MKLNSHFIVNWVLTGKTICERKSVLLEKKNRKYLWKENSYFVLNTVSYMPVFQAMKNGGFGDECCP